MRHALIITAAAMALAACATSEGYRQQTEQFLGAHADTLIVEFGSPMSRDRLSDGSEVWTYQSRERRFQPGGYRSVPRERRITYRDSEGRRRERTEQYTDTVYEPPREWTVECETRFILSPDRRVTDFRFQGEGCVAPEIY
ncbi:hypothetical protein F1654_08605 [Alkalicaulis satelles]|uniref:Outer membrane protein assembly factor BamE n=1 Tax=Alkalicaulis satelles TaxID=2609175 RepID=A0A5M6ZGK0_9PROT|nr:hypothetical protein [Alkalicaulis satelles]KAA5803849.1 hypothetical protein F1654_08605 [Alkalicaulis satelles]